MLLSRRLHKVTEDDHEKVETLGVSRIDVGTS